VRIAEWHSYLVLLGSSTGKSQSRVVLVPSLSDAIRSWDGRTRISPLFGISDVAIQSSKRSRFNSTSNLYFIGPIAPFEVSQLIAKLPKRSNVWISTGAYNFVIQIHSTLDSKNAKQWLDNARCRWECWEIRDSLITNVQYSRIPGSETQTWKDSLSALQGPDDPPELRDAIEEYRALMVSGIARSEEVYPPFTADLLTANEIILSRIAAAKSAASADTIAMLVDVNAGLSRFASQAFSGASPIRETECHFWTHSLLGIGVANIALANSRRFLTRTLGEARIPERVAEYRTVQRNLPDLISASSFGEKPWTENWIDKTDIGERRKPLFPQITYFSGRDGFKTTETTLSAPLSAITSCSSTRWTLLTITHEASHTIISGVLSIILPKFNDPDELETAVKNLNGATPANLLEDIQNFLLRVMVEMAEQSDQHPVPDHLTTAFVTEVVRRWRDEVEEIMVHTFDFLYFYGQQIDYYLAAIWRSWDTIPHLNSRIHDYTLRTLCVAASRHLGSPTMFRAALKDSKDALSTVVNSFGPTSYVKLALDRLEEYETDSAEVEMQIQVRLGVVALVKAFLHSPKLLQRVRGQSGVSRRATQELIKASSDLEFRGTRIENPLAFIEDETSAQADEARSLWILQRLAFDVE